MANFQFDGNVIHISGDISINESRSLYNFLSNLPVTGDEIKVNLSGAELWDSSTMQIFISWTKSSARKIVWKNISPEMKSDLKLMGLFSLFKEDEK
ncbi:MAG TPA: STAS domain-containing protein [bacterium]|nr:STAS domain-containing protein [bacterium]